MKKNRVNTGKKYLPARIEKILDETANYPLSVVEAPVGYGKSSFVNAFLEKKAGSYVWMTVKDTSESYFWEELCESLSRIDPEAAKKLTRMPFPNTNLRAVKAADMMREMLVVRQTYLVIDDYHVISSRNADQLFTHIAGEPLQNLHIILITRNRFKTAREEMLLKNKLYIVDAGDLRLTDEECEQYLNLCGHEPGREELAQICARADGWISALYFTLENLKKGRKRIAASADAVFRSALYEKYTQAQKDLLMRLCVFPEFTRSQAHFVAKQADATAALERLIDGGTFITYDEETGKYHIQRLFLDFLQNRLVHRDDDYKKKVWRRAADWHSIAHNYNEASRLYRMAHDYDEMLSAYEKSKFTDFFPLQKDSLLNAFDECAADVRMRHPVALICCARQLFMIGETQRAGEILTLMESETWDGAGIPEERLEGEIHILRGFLSYNDIDRMAECWDEAAKYLTGVSLTENVRSGLMQGVPSLLQLYAREPLSASRLPVRMKKSRETYFKITGGNGYAASFMADAELRYMRGYTERAEIISYRILRMTRERRQTETMMSALFLQARIFMLRGNKKKGLDSLKYMEEAAESADAAQLSAMSEAAHAFIYVFSHQTKPISDTILEGRFSEERAGHPLFSFLSIIYVKSLIERSQYTRALGECEQLLEIAGARSYMMTRIYLNIFAAAAFYKIGNPDEACEALKKALSLAESDEIAIPFVENGKDIMPVLDILTSQEQAARPQTAQPQTARPQTARPQTARPQTRRGRQDTPQLRQEQSSDSTQDSLPHRQEQAPRGETGFTGSFTDRIYALYEEHKESISEVIADREESPLGSLTKREQQIATLVAEGNTNRQIADLLNIAEITVKKSLSKIYARLDVKNRAELVRKIIT